MMELLVGVLILFILVGALLAALKFSAMQRALHEFPAAVAYSLEEKHRAMLSDLHEGLTGQGDRIAQSLGENIDRLRSVIYQELTLTREAMQSLQLSQNDTLGKTRETVLQQLAEFSLATQSRLDALRTEMTAKTLQTLAEQGRAQQDLIQSTMRNASAQIVGTVEGLSKTLDQRLDQISGKVSERLDEGFKKTNDTFVNVMARLATIDEAQKKIDGLTTNVVSLQQLLGDKRSRGAFGEVQLEALVRNMLPTQSYAFQHTLSSNHRCDCVLFLPEPTGHVVIDSKFPLENYHRMFAADVSEVERMQVQKLFRKDIRNHVDAISQKYIIANETSDGALMFVPAESVFAEIHGYHGEVVEYAMQKRVWIVSPTTMMAILNTARAVIKDVETRKQIHIIKDALGKLSKDFHLFDSRMKKLANHIRQAHEDAQDVEISSRKITQRFSQIEAVELEQQAQVQLDLVKTDDTPTRSAG